MSNNDDLLLESGAASPVASNTALGAVRCDDTSLAEAKREVEQTEARAAAARERATRLSRQADSASSGQLHAIEVDRTKAQAKQRHQAKRAGLVSRLRPPGRRTLPICAAVALICISLGLNGFVVHSHLSAVDERHRAEEFAGAAQRGATALMAIDASTARDGVQRIIDDSTGPFKIGILLSEDDLVKAVENSKVSTKVAVKAVAVESMTDDSAVVLVASKTEVANPDKGKPTPRSWRVVMTIQRDGGKLKIAKVESLP